MTIEISTKTQIEKIETVEVLIPSFYVSKDEREWVAVLDEDTLVEMTILPGIATYVSNKSISNSINAEAYISKAVNTMHSCVESIWLEKFDSVIQSLYLHPMLKP
jgi:hypothetical protein